MYSQQNHSNHILPLNNHHLEYQTWSLYECLISSFNYDPKWAHKKSNKQLTRIRMCIIMPFLLPPYIKLIISYKLIRVHLVCIVIVCAQIRCLEYFRQLKTITPQKGTLQIENWTLGRCLDSQFLFTWYVDVIYSYLMRILTMFCTQVLLL